MTHKKIKWENKPLEAVVIDASLLNADTIRITASDGLYYDTNFQPYIEPIQPQKMIPLICTQCGGSVDKDTNKCRMCGTEFVWR